MKRLWVGIAFLTRVPNRTVFTAEDVGRAALVFPLVGAVIGLVQLGFWRLASPHVPSLLLAVLLVSFSAWLTRALHLDGLADFVDGLGGGRTREESLRVMKDARIGAFGAIALVLVLGTKIAAIDALASPFALVLAPALSRWTLVALGYALPYAGRSDAPSVHIGKLELVGATLVTAVLAAMDAPLASLMWTSVVIVSVGVASVAKDRLGGVTGDVLGANLELAEAAALVAAIGWQAEAATTWP